MLPRFDNPGVVSYFELTHGGGAGRRGTAAERVAKGVPMDVAKTLTGHDFFRPFTPDQVEKISRFATSRTLAAGDVVHELNDKTDFVFLLLEGRVELRLPGEAGESGILIKRVVRGDLFGIASILGADRYTTRGVCTEDSKVLFIEAQPLLLLLRANPEIDRLILRVVARTYFNRYQILAELVQRFLSDPGLR
jgi:CRP-like cAMP-binding protein